MKYTPYQRGVYWAKIFQLANKKAEEIWNSDEVERLDRYDKLRRVAHYAARRIPEDELSLKEFFKAHEEAKRLQPSI